MLDTTTLLSKATTIKIVPTYKSKNHVQHYAVIFYGIPFTDKDHRTLYSEVIYHNCTFTHRNANLLFTYEEIDKYNIQINKKQITISRPQLFLYDLQFAFEYHEELGTTRLITIQYPKEN